MEKNLVLTFNTEDKKTYRVKFRNPKDNLNIDSINLAASKLITTNILNNSKRSLKDLKKASYVTREETIIN
ncbi:DUF2922 domain-containing protein [Gemella sp. GH3]|uniref:DUF2922 domain-containing protein n=1 Tax=unclassified Gemella TaxID=2624949 RepID=UPI0015D006D2|nr:MULTISPECIES: DUF2922 domain-containing protein [unclassified Gemella]MBF0713594.1 DUF2922 domain-containing protein [Gemella sp. GH3.1]NYS50546.1 DUF2922 domain-containing protein [Gemella sp. GH3]